MPLRLLIVMLLLPVLCFGQQTYYEEYEAGMEAKKAGHTRDFLDHMEKADSLRPLHPTILYRLGTALLMNDREQEGFHTLEKSLMLHAGMPLDKDEDLDAFRQTTRFESLLSFRDSLLRPVQQSRVSFELDETDLHAEGLAYDPVAGDWYIGSVHLRKIIRRDKSGQITDFISSGEGGLMAVMGVETDVARGILWVSSVPAREMINYGERQAASVISYDMKTGKKLDEFVVEDTVGHWFGDLAVDRNGNVFVSDSFTNSIYLISGGEISLWLDGTGVFENLQGIDLMDDQVIVSDYLTTLCRIDLVTREISMLENPFPELILKGTDGVTVYDQSVLLTINGLFPNRLIRLDLDPGTFTVRAYHILDWNHEAYGEPTLGTVVKGSFYYVGNSSWGAYTEDYKLPKESLPAVRILSIPLE